MLQREATFRSVYPIKAVTVGRHGGLYDHSCLIRYSSTHSINIRILFFFKVFVYLFIYGCVGSSFLCEGFL